MEKVRDNKWEHKFAERLRQFWKKEQGRSRRFDCKSWGGGGPGKRKGILVRG